MLKTSLARAQLGGAADERELREVLLGAVGALEARTGLRLGSTRAPLLLSVRSGAPVSMPGMLETVLDVGMCEASVRGLIALTRQRAAGVGLLPALRRVLRHRRARLSRASPSSRRSTHVSSEAAAQSPRELSAHVARGADALASRALCADDRRGAPAGPCWTSSQPQCGLCSPPGGRRRPASTDVCTRSPTISARP